MTEITYALCFALSALAIWRVAHLVARENGPWDLIARLRGNFGSGVLGSLMDCFYCLSFTLALAPALWMSRNWTGFLVQWLALSAAACLAERATQGPQSSFRVSYVSRSYLDKVIGGA
jgi:hypothetical protein